MWRKIRISLLVLTLIGLLVVGTSIAYFTDDGDVNVAKFDTSTVKIEFSAKPQVSTANPYALRRQAKWTIANIGESDAYLRAKVINETERDELGIDGEIVLETSGDTWVKGKGTDKYYYCINPVKPEDHVEFCLEVSFDSWEPGSFPIDIEVEAIQTTNNAINLEWSNNPL